MIDDSEDPVAATPPMPAAKDKDQGEGVKKEAGGDTPDKASAGNRDSIETTENRDKDGGEMPTPTREDAKEPATAVAGEELPRGVRARLRKPRLPAGTSRH